MTTTELQAQLRRGAERLRVPLTDASCARLLDYLGILERWNRTWNLTAVRSVDEMVSRHLLDCLAVAPFLHGRRVLDVGTGAGLPGIALAVAEADRQFVLLDSNGKKTRFVQHAVGRLGLQNVEVVRSRVEDYRPPESFETVVSRAFASLADLIGAAGPLCADTGRVLSMKGELSAEELRELPREWQLTEVHRLSVPDLDRARHLLVCTRRP